MAVILGMVLVVMLLMNGALFYVLRTAVLTTRRQVESCFVRELEDYNGFLEDKAEECSQIEEKKDGLKKEISEMEGVMLSLKTSPFYAPRPIARELFIPTSRYIECALGNSKFLFFKASTISKITSLPLFFSIIL